MNGLTNAGIRPTSVDTKTSLRVTVLAFARLRELLGSATFELELESGARVCDVWNAVLDRCGALAPLEGSTRLAKNGRIASPDEAIEDGDEIALLPPVGGG